MPEAEIARCVVCGKVELVQGFTGVVVDLGDGVVVVGVEHVDHDDPPMYWPDGMALASCEIHTEDDRLAAFAKYPPTHWMEGRPHAEN